MAEVKTTVLKHNADYRGNDLQKWIEKRSLSQQKEFINKRRVGLKKPNWIKSQEVFDSLLYHVAATIKWRAYFNKNEYVDLVDHNENVSLNLVTGRVGRQLLAEMLSIAPKVEKSKYVTGSVYLVNLKQDFSYDSCIYCRIKVPKDVLYNILDDISRIFYDRFS